MPNNTLKFDRVTGRYGDMLCSLRKEHTRKYSEFYNFRNIFKFSFCVFPIQMFNEKIETLEGEEKKHKH